MTKQNQTESLKTETPCPLCGARNTLGPWRSECFPDVKYTACVVGDNSCGYILSHKEARAIQTA